MNFFAGNVDLDNSAATRLRIGIAIRSGKVPAWQAALIRTVANSEVAELASLFVVADAPVSRPDAPASASRAGFVYRQFLRMESAGSRTAPDALADTDIGDPHVEVEARDAIGVVRAARLDVLLALAQVETLMQAAPVVRLGVWHFEAGGHAFSPADGSMVGFLEVLKREPVLEGTLRIRTQGKPHDLVAYLTRSAVHPRSHFLTCNEHLWKCSSMLVRALRACSHCGTSSYLASLAQAPQCSPPPAPMPSLGALVAYAGWRAARTLEHRKFTERWLLFLGKPDGEVDPRSFVPLAPPKGRFWADPHVVAESGHLHIFFEDASCATGKGHIAVMTIGPDGSMGDVVPVLQRDYHLSYPFVFRWRDEYYMVPESAENGTVELYRCTRMPDRWEFAHNLMEGVHAYDATLVEHAGRWWLFANVAERPGSSTWDELCIFHSDSPVSRDWAPHPANPVVSDVRRSRPAGRFFRLGPKLIRPSQDSSGRYGRALVWNEVIELNERRYRERAVRVIDPDWDPAIKAVHSYSSAGDVAVIDAIRQEPR